MFDDLRVVCSECNLRTTCTVAPLYLLTELILTYFCVTSFAIYQSRLFRCELLCCGDKRLQRDVSCPLSLDGWCVSLTDINRHKTTPVWTARQHTGCVGRVSAAKWTFWWRCFVNSCKDCVIQCDLLWLTRAGIIMVCACVGCHAALLSSFSHL